MDDPFKDIVPIEPPDPDRPHHGADPLAGMVRDPTPDFAPGGGGSAAGPPAPTASDEAIRDCAAEPLNDFGNGRRLVRHFGENMLWVPRVGWFYWTGTVWAKDPDTILIRGRAHQVADLIKRESRYLAADAITRDHVDRRSAAQTRLRALRALPDPDRAAADAEIAAVQATIADLDKVLTAHDASIGSRLRHAKNAGNSGPISNMIAEGGVGLARALDDLDAGPLLINTLSGVLRFTTAPVRPGSSVQLGEVVLLPHAGDSNRPLLLTKMIPVAYDPEARCPVFTRFLDRIMPDRDMQGFLQRWFGLNMTALTGDQKLCYFYGMGANGKSVLIDLIARILGEYSATAKIESLTGTNRRGGGDATPDLVPLMGARMVRASEPDEGVKWQEGLIKDLTGGEPLLIRALHSDFVSARPVFKLTITGNHKPDIRGTDDGIWRRLLLIPFEEQIPPEERIPKNELDATLFAEAPGVLNWMVEGLLHYLEGGLNEPDQIKLATAAFREESDPYGTFLDDACVVTGAADDSLSAREMVNAFHFWLERRAEGLFKDRTVSLALKDRSRRWRSRKTGHRFTARKSSSAYYDGIRFTDIFAATWKLVTKDAKGRATSTRSDEDAPPSSGADGFV
jgi:putative DNA primase/helicase